jgi:pimeloyl-ACP methyl ester carboxylesterase
VGSCPIRLFHKLQFIALVAACFLAVSPLVAVSEVVLRQIELTATEINWMKSSGLSRFATTVDVAIALPEGQSLSTLSRGAPYPLLLTCVTGDLYQSNIAEMEHYHPTGTAEGWIVLTGWISPRPQPDTRAFRRAISSAALRALAREVPESTEWPVAVAGFSGGGKNAPVTAAYLHKDGRQIIGIFMGGANDDTASWALGKIVRRKADFKTVPLFLSNGENDRIAPVAKAQKMAERMRRKGFNEVELATYAGPHILYLPHVKAALSAFREAWISTSPARP